MLFGKQPCINEHMADKFWGKIYMSKGRNNHVVQRRKDRKGFKQLFVFLGELCAPIAIGIACYFFAQTNSALFSLPRKNQIQYLLKRGGKPLAVNQKGRY